MTEGNGQAPCSALSCACSSQTNAVLGRLSRRGEVDGYLAVVTVIAAGLCSESGLPCGASMKCGSRGCQRPVAVKRQPADPPNGCCRMHGGTSTGPRTEPGRAAV